MILIFIIIPKQLCSKQRTKRCCWLLIRLARIKTFVFLHVYILQLKYSSINIFFFSKYLSTTKFLQKKFRCRARLFCYLTLSCPVAITWLRPLSRACIYHNENNVSNGILTMVVKTLLG